MSFDDGCDRQAYAEDVDDDADEHHLELERPSVYTGERDDHPAHEEVHRDSVERTRKHEMPSKKANVPAGQEEHRGCPISDGEVANEPENGGGGSRFEGPRPEQSAGDALQNA